MGRNMAEAKSFVHYLQSLSAAIAHAGVPGTGEFRGSLGADFRGRNTQ